MKKLMYRKNWQSKIFGNLPQKRPKITFGGLKLGGRHPSSDDVIAYGTVLFCQLLHARYVYLAIYFLVSLSHAARNHRQRFLPKMSEQQRESNSVGPTLDCLSLRSSSIHEVLMWTKSTI